MVLHYFVKLLEFSISIFSLKTRSLHSAPWSSLIIHLLLFQSIHPSAASTSALW